MVNEFTCEYCSHNFKTEKNYLKHCCEKMKRHDLFKTTKGRAAFFIYNEWRKLSGFPKSSVDTFINSRYFKSFIKFVDFSNHKMLPDRMDYIQYMVENKIIPMFWSDEDFYEKYMIYFDNEISVERKLEITKNTIIELCGVIQCPLDKLFDNLTPIETLKLVIARKLSPWFLLFDQHFLNFVLYKTNKEEKILFNKIIDPKKWKQEFKEKKNKLNDVREFIRQLSI